MWLFDFNAFLKLIENPVSIRSILAQIVLVIEKKNIQFSALKV